MKPLPFAAALALSCTLVVMVSAQQCDLSAAFTCVTNFADMVSKDCMAVVLYMHNVYDIIMIILH